MITTEQAIDALEKRISPYTNCAADAEANEVIRMAIKALKQGEVLNEIWLEIEGLKFDYEPNTLYKIHNKAISTALRIIDRHREESACEKYEKGQTDGRSNQHRG